MRKIVLLSIIVFISISIKAQENFEWDKIIEIEGTADQLFSKAKMVLASDFNDSENVTRNSDKEAGVIFVKAQETVYKSFSMYGLTFYFQYELTILVKENKVRINLKNVNNFKVLSQDYQTLPYRRVPVSTTYPAANDKEGKKKFGLKAKQYFEVMKPLRNQLQDVFDMIVKDLQADNIINDDW